ncbi:branched-chain amino acid transport system II carrier protein [Ureibacillus sinduriensis]|uniref:Branched-chain amino acid transport system carrier protein n=1 Tax=Ureibacillus sinduriensis BLB-1 = JCM 15800 TaxID=1384057 RepID=A0A0A3HVQ7_9BACL|nr:branched-chain amino acid transport system II carrier protein [Ureibacillus sinduriensis]KGR74388.1 branched-chain amino acid transporter [Ureibacillus sinduriensis BLB-1 = JCM 15800]
MNSLSSKDLLFIVFMLFSMFFGAGNLIFPAFLGNAAGTEMWVSLAGFIITAVGLPILGVIAVGKAGSLNTLSTRVHPWFAMVFPFLIYLSIGPGLAIPRAGTVAYEMSIKPFLPNALSGSPAMLFLYTLVFFALVLYLSLSPSKLVDRFGKLLTPILLFLIAIIFVKAILTPVDSLAKPIELYANNSFFQGFLDGYLTMDALAALVYGIVVVNTIRLKGIKDDSSISRYMLFAGLGAGILLAIIYSILTFLGASVSALEQMNNGANVLTLVMNELFGQTGIILLGVLFTVACLCVSISLVISCGEYFSRLIPFFSYKTWATIVAVISFIIANLGLNQILAISVPILGAIYPLAIVLIVLGLLNRFVNHSIYLYGIILTAIFSFIDTINTALLDKAWSNILGIIPLYEQGVGWVVPAIVGIAIGAVVGASKVRKLNK